MTDPTPTAPLTDPEAAAAQAQARAARTQATADAAAAEALAATHAATPPVVYPALRWAGPAFIPGVPTVGSGPDGALTPDEVQAYLGGRPGLLDQVRKDGTYVPLPKGGH